jgi:hypothetical protein
LDLVISDTFFVIGSALQGRTDTCWPPGQANSLPPLQTDIL